jgi:23S rRNA (adenine-N6)-dimethyltransferase
MSWCGVVLPSLSERSVTVEPTHPVSLQHSQNFLRSRTLVDRLLDASSIEPDDLVLDLGAGSGLIASRAARRGCRVVAIEQDPELVAELERRFAKASAVRVCHADILRAPLPGRPYNVFANIPFNASAAIVTRLTDSQRSPDDAYLIVQHEAAQRCLGEPRLALFSLLLKPWFEPTIVHRFRRGDFNPAPHVEVVMLRLHKRGPPLVAPELAQLFRDFAVHAWTCRNRPLSKTLRRLFGDRTWRRIETRLGLQPTATPTGLGFDQWLELFFAFQRVAPPVARALVSGADQRLRRQQRRLSKRHRTCSEATAASQLR